MVLPANGVCPSITSDKINGAKPAVNPPPIPHITENYVSLSALVCRLTEAAYLDLTTLLDSLPTDSDVGKKRRLLDYCITTRQQFIKVMVLVMWYRQCTGISRCIDVVSFLDGQKHCFGNVVSALRHVRSDMVAARVRNPDIKSAVDVLSTGTYPRLRDPTYDEVPDMSTTATLDTLRALNVVLSLRLSLHEPIPPPLAKYHVANGRATFVAQHEFEVDLSVASESSLSQWFVIDFRWAFKPNFSLSERMRTEVERLGNGILQRAVEKPLFGLYNALHAFCLSYKLALMHDQAKKLATGKWSGSLSSQLTPGKVSMEYWKGLPGGKHLIEVAVDTLSSEFCIRWLRDGAETDTGFSICFSVVSTSELLSQVTNIHSKLLLLNLKCIIDFAPTNLRNPDCLIVQLTHSRTIEISINKCTGYYRIEGEGSSNLYSTAVAKLNSEGSNVRDVIQRLRALAQQQDLTTLAKATGWDCPPIVFVNADDLKTLTGGSKCILYLRRKSWCKDWFLLGSFDHNGIKWWIAEVYVILILLLTKGQTTNLLHFNFSKKFPCLQMRYLIILFYKLFMSFRSFEWRHCLFNVL